MDVPTPAPATARRRRTRFCRRLGAVGISATLSLGALAPLTIDGEAEAAGRHPRRRVAALVNARRIEAGLRPLRWRGRIYLAAQKHSRYQARRQLMTHTGRGGSDCGDRIRREGYRWSAWGENVAMGYRTPRAVVRAWMHSAGHRANILNRRFRHVGVGLKRDENGIKYWTLDFARPG
jgi:uncharacterized protein YkwD